MEDKKYICKKCEVSFNHQSSYCRHKKKCQPNENQNPSKSEIESKLMQSEMEKMQLENKLLQTELKLLQTENKLAEEKKYNKYTSECDDCEMMRCFIKDLCKRP